MFLMDIKHRKKAEAEKYCWFLLFTLIKSPYIGSPHSDVAQFLHRMPSLTSPLSAGGQKSRQEQDSKEEPGPSRWETLPLCNCCWMKSYLQRVILILASFVVCTVDLSTSYTTMFLLFLLHLVNLREQLIVMLYILRSLLDIPWLRTLFLFTNITR